MNLETLRKRSELLAETRAFFRDRGFAEVETPMACDEVIPEAHIEPVRTADGLFLQASPEMEMKRLLCQGSGPIFQLCKAFRDDEHGRLHRREFTMLEWYRPGDEMRAGMQLLDEFVQATLGTPPFKRTSYRDAFWQACGVDPLNSDRRELIKAADGIGDEVTDRDELLNFLLAKRVEPILGEEAPEILYHYPASQAALATTTQDALGIEVAERFELYVCDCGGASVELANGYHELTDANELRRRLVKANELRVADGREALPLPEKLLADMTSPGLPPCAGVALGFDRLVMLAVGADSIGEVMPRN